MFILPGSHNKFVAMSAEGKILGCMTSISGELLDAMTHHTILADAVGGAFVAPEAYDSRMAMEGAWACSQSGLGRAAFSGRILKTLGKRSHAEVQSYLLGAALALVMTDVLQALSQIYRHGSAAFAAAAALTGRELLLIVPLAPLLYLPLHWIYRRTRGVYT